MELERTINGWSRYYELSDPERLRGMSRGQILEQLPTLGREHVNRLTAEGLRERHPLLLAKLAEHPCIALMLVRSA